MRFRIGRRLVVGWSIVLAAAVLAAPSASVLAGSAGPRGGSTGHHAGGTFGTFGPVTMGHVEIRPDGRILVSDCGNARIYAIGPRGSINVVVGAGDGGFTNGYSGNGGPALDAHFACIVGMANALDGSLTVGDHLNDVIRRIDRRGIVSTIVGREADDPLWLLDPTPGVGPEAGDGGSARFASLDAPWGIAYDNRGNLYIADRDHDAIRMVDRRGIITTVAGTGVRGYSGDGGPATQAEINRPTDMAVRNGSLIVADENNSRIRRVAPNGTITTIGGTGQLGCTGDGIPAVQAPIQNPNSLRVGPDGSIYFSEEECQMVRRIAPDGTIHRVLGIGVDGCRGLDGGRAVDAMVSTPGSIDFGPNGDLYVADSGCNVLLRIDHQGRVHVVVDASTVS